MLGSYNKRDSSSGSCVMLANNYQKEQIKIKPVSFLRHIVCVCFSFILSVDLLRRSFEPFAFQLTTIWLCCEWYVRRDCECKALLTDVFTFYLLVPIVFHVDRFYVWLAVGLDNAFFFIHSAALLRSVLFFFFFSLVFHFVDLRRVRTLSLCVYQARFFFAMLMPYAKR